MLVVLLAVSFSVFYPDISRAYVVFPVVIWAALRFWQPGAAASALIVTAVAIPLTLNDHGAFSGYSPDDGLQLAQTFVATLSATGLVLAAVMTERQRIEDAARYISETLQEGLLPARLPEIPGIERFQGRAGVVP